MSEHARPIERIALIGVGLIGGSFALALKRAGLAREIVGADRSSESLERALVRGAITERVASAEAAVQGADLVVLAVPVGQMAATLGKIAPHLAPAAIVTDVGSTKQQVVRLGIELLADRLGNFVPAHPIAGSERSGVDAASESLFDGRNVVLTPLAETLPASVARVRQTWEACGARVQTMRAGEHDSIFAAVSHLPHLLAFGLVSELAARQDADQFFDFAASGFRDFTRIAASSPEMWRDICLANQDALLIELVRYQEQLGEIHRLLEARNGAGLEALFSLARDKRNTWAAEHPQLFEATK